MVGLWIYFWYVVRHKWYVTWECWKRGLFWRGLTHDLDKFYPSEFFPYARHFYLPDGTKRSVRDKTGYYKPTDTGDVAFDFAWFLHQKRNDHHWQWWVFPDDGPGLIIDEKDKERYYQLKIFPMSEPAAREMLCDWIGAGKAQGTPGVQVWYEKNKEKLILHPKTRKMVEQWLATL